MTHQPSDAPKFVHVVDKKTRNAAEKYRLLQAENLLREAGFVQAPDGSWHPADES